MRQYLKQGSAGHSQSLTNFSPGFSIKEAELNSKFKENLKSWSRPRSRHFCYRLHRSSHEASGWRHYKNETRCLISSAFTRGASVSCTLYCRGKDCLVERPEFCSSQTYAILDQVSFLTPSSWFGESLAVSFRIPCFGPSTTPFCDIGDNQDTECVPFGRRGDGDMTLCSDTPITRSNSNQMEDTVM